jgi:hypothetical protein
MVRALVPAVGVLAIAGMTAVAQTESGSAVAFTELSIKPSQTTETSVAGDTARRRFVIRGGPVLMLIHQGLTLEPITMPARVFVIDRIQRPITD